MVTPNNAPGKLVAPLQLMILVTICMSKGILVTYKLIVIKHDRIGIRAFEDKCGEQIARCLHG